jgi:hypothetical protein
VSHRRVLLKMPRVAALDDQQKKLAALKFLTLGTAAIARKNQVKMKHGLRYIYMLTTAIAHGGRCGGRWWEGAIVVVFRIYGAGNGPYCCSQSYRKSQVSGEPSSERAQSSTSFVMMAGVFVTAVSQSGQHHHWQEVRNDQRRLFCPYVCIHNNHQNIFSYNQTLFAFSIRIILASCGDSAFRLCVLFTIGWSVFR